MSGIIVLFPIILFVICFAVAFDISKAKRHRRIQRVNRPWENMSLPKKDIFQSYSSKNKECYEHEAKESIDDPKPKKKWSLWNEPSWDDELK